MRHHPSQPKLQEYGCAVLANLLALGGASAQGVSAQLLPAALKRCGVLRLVARAMRAEYAGSRAPAALLAEGSAVLSRAAACRGLLAELLACGAPPLLLSLLEAPLPSTPSSRPRMPDAPPPPPLPPPPPVEVPPTSPLYGAPPPVAPPPGTPTPTAAAAGASSSSSSWAAAPASSSVPPPAPRGMGRTNSFADAAHEAVITANAAAALHSLVAPLRNRLILPRHLPAADNSVARGPLRELLPGVALARGWLRHAQAAHDLDGCFALPLPLGGAAAVRAAEPFAELCALASTAVPGHRPAPLPAPPQRARRGGRVRRPPRRLRSRRRRRRATARPPPPPPWSTSWSPPPPRRASPGRRASPDVPAAAPAAAPAAPAAPAAAPLAAAPPAVVVAFAAEAEDNEVDGIGFGDDLLQLLLSMAAGDLRTACAAACVCARWRRLLRGGAALHRIVLTEYSNELAQGSLSLPALLSLPLGGPRALSFSQLGVLRDTALQEALPRCSRLGALDLSLCPSLSAAAGSIVASHCQQLAELDLSGLTAIDDVSLADVAAHCAPLRAICLNGCTGVGDAGVSALAAGCVGLSAVHAFGCTRLGEEGALALARAAARRWRRST